MTKQELINQLGNLKKTLDSFCPTNATVRDWAEIADQCMFFQENIADSLSELKKDDVRKLL